MPGGRIERLRIPGGPGVPLVVLGGVETSLRLLAGTESLLRRWAARRPRQVTVVGRPIPDDPADADVLLHPRWSAAAVAVALGDLAGPFAIEAESGGGRISLWLTVDHPEPGLAARPRRLGLRDADDSPMAVRMRNGSSLGERGDWGEFFGRMALQMRPGGEASDAPPAGSFAAAASLQPGPPPRSGSSPSCGARSTPARS